MSYSEKDFAIDKIKLIYEFNDDSPLFARVAASEIKNGNILDALRILEKGTAMYPSYSTAYFILAIAQAYTGKEEEAVNSAAIGSELLGSVETFDYYKKEIQKILSERNTLTEAKRPAFIEEEDEIKLEDDFENFEDKLDLLAEKLSKAKIIPKEIGEPTEEVSPPEANTKKIVSDTLAEIFLSQKHYQEALAIYADLLKQKPEKAGIYLQKISDINSLIEK